MDPSRPLADLRRHQAAVLAVIEGARALMAEPSAETAAALARSRWELVRLLRGYQLFKHGELFDPLIRRGPPTQRAAAEGMKARCIALGEEFAAYVRTWSASDIVAEWERYRPAMLAMTDRLRVHLRREASEAIALLAAGSRAAA